MTTYTSTHFNTAAEIKKLFIDLTIIVNCVSHLKFTFNVIVVPLY